MRTSADHTNLEQSTKVSLLGITGSYRHVRGNKRIGDGTYNVDTGTP